MSCGQRITTSNSGLEVAGSDAPAAFGAPMTSDLRSKFQASRALFHQREASSSSLSYFEVVSKIFLRGLEALF